MNRLALAAVLLAATATTASAGGYVGLGIGTGPATSGDAKLQEDGRSGRLQLGYRFGRLSIEGIGSHAGVDGSKWGYTYPAPMSWTSVGVAGKYNLPLGDNFEAFGRLGYQRTYLSIENDPKFGSESFAGDGILLGAGFEYRINLGVVGGSIFVDYTIDHSDLTSPDYPTNQHWGMTNRIWTLGATVSL